MLRLSLSLAIISFLLIKRIVKGFDRNECGYISKEKYNQILLEIGSGKLSEKSDMV